MFSPFHALYIYDTNTDFEIFVLVPKAKGWDKKKNNIRLRTMFFCSNDLFKLGVLSVDLAQQLLTNILRNTNFL